jgi:hypothetical protein
VVGGGGGRWWEVGGGERWRRRPSSSAHAYVHFYSSRVAPRLHLRVRIRRKTSTKRVATNRRWGAECPYPPSLPRRGGGGPSVSPRIARAWAATRRPRRIDPAPFNHGPSFVLFLAIVFAVAISPCSCRTKFIVGPSRAKPTHRRERATPRVVAPMLAYH